MVVVVVVDGITGADIARLFASLRQESSAEVAISFLLDLANLAAEEAELTLQSVVSVYAENLHRVKKRKQSMGAIKEAAWNDLEAGAYQEYITNTTEWAASKGLGVNSFMLNGLMLDTFEYSQNLMMLLAR